VSYVYRDEVLADKPTLFWRLDESDGAAAHDETGMLPGLYDLGTAQRRPSALPGEGRAAAGFDGVDDTVRLASGSAANVGTGSFSVESWVNTTTTTEVGIVTKRTSATPPGWSLSVTDHSGKEGRARVKMHGTRGQVNAYSSSRINDGRWHHVVAVVDRANGVRVYVDGLAGPTAVAVSDDLSNDEALRVGREPGDPSLEGDLDEVALYSHALTPERVRRHWEAAQPRYVREVLRDSPALYLRFGEASTVWSARDLIGERNGLYELGVVRERPGALQEGNDGAAGFDGADARVRWEDDNALNVGAGDFTAEAWVRVAAPTMGGILAKGSASSAAGWRLTVTDDPGYVGRPRMMLHGPSGRMKAYGPVAIDDGNWHHVDAVVSRDQGVHVLVDGVAGERVAAISDDLDNTSNFRVGQRSGETSLAGDIDEAAMYGSAVPDERSRAVSGPDDRSPAWA